MNIIAYGVVEMESFVNTVWRRENEKRQVCTNRINNTYC